MLPRMETHVLDHDGRRVQWYSAGDTDAPITVMWHHGTPNSGAVPEPLIEPARALGIRLVSFDRPGYGGSEGMGARRVSDLVPVMEIVANAADAHRCAAVGYSGGGPHALAMADALQERTYAVAVIAGLCPPAKLKWRWMRGMAGPSAAILRAALKGGDALRDLLVHKMHDPDMFTGADQEALQDDWHWLTESAATAVDDGLEGAAADNLAFVADWGFKVASLSTPVLVVQGTEDRVVPYRHGRVLAKKIPEAEYWERENHGHLSILRESEAVLEWIAERAAASSEEDA